MIPLGPVYESTFELFANLNIFQVAYRKGAVGGKRFVGHGRMASFIVQWPRIIGSLAFMNFKDP